MKMILKYLDDNVEKQLDVFSQSLEGDRNELVFVLHVSPLVIRVKR